VAVAPAQTGFTTGLSDPYVDTPAATTNSLTFNATAAAFAVGVKSIQPANASVPFKVGDAIAMQVVITPTTATHSSGMLLLKASSYTSQPTVFTAAASNLNPDGSLSASVSCPISNACGSNDALTAVLASGQYTQSTVVSQNGVPA